MYKLKHAALIKNRCQLLSSLNTQMWCFCIKRTRGTSGYQKVDSTSNALQKDLALMNITNLLQKKLTPKIALRAQSHVNRGMRLSSIFSCQRNDHNGRLEQFVPFMIMTLSKIRWPFMSNRRAWLTRVRTYTHARVLLCPNKYSRLVSGGEHKYDSEDRKGTRASWQFLTVTTHGLHHFSTSISEPKLWS